MELPAELLPDVSDLVTESDEEYEYPLTEDMFPDVDALVTEDDEPVDNLFSEKQQRLLVEPLYSSFRLQAAPEDDSARTYLAAANVALYPSIRKPPLVPDVFLSLDVQVPDNWWDKGKRSYFLWEFGKPPEVVIEIVSNLKGKETTTKLSNYAQMRVAYYAIFDPIQQLGGPLLQLYKLQASSYIETTDFWLEDVQLGLTTWEGSYEGKHDVWLRWCDQDRNVLLTGTELAEQERQQKELALQRVEQLADRLRSLGIDPESL